MTRLARSRAQLSCPSVGMPQPEVTWTRNGDPLTEADGVDPVNATLTIRDMSVDSQGAYTCTATNIYGSDSKSSFFTVLGE